MLSGLMNFFQSCFGPRSDRYVHSGSDSMGRQDGLLWYKDIGQHLNGEFSVAVVQANSLLEDKSQVESGSLTTDGSGPLGTFVGIYDGHGGPETSQFINDQLFQHLKSKWGFKSLRTLYASVISSDGVRICSTFSFIKSRNCISETNGRGRSMVAQPEAKPG